MSFLVHPDKNRDDTERAQKAFDGKHWFSKLLLTQQDAVWPGHTVGYCLLWHYVVDLRNKTCFPCLHSLLKTEANIWENSRVDLVENSHKLCQGFHQAMEAQKTCFIYFIKLLFSLLTKRKTMYKVRTVNSHIWETVKPHCSHNFRASYDRVFVKICNNRDLFPSNRDQNGYAAISRHALASGRRCGRGSPPPTGGVLGKF